MSVKAMSAAFEIGDRLNLSAIDRLILLRLGDWADDYGYAFPGVNDLVSKVGVDERTIRRHLTDMESSRLVIRLYGKGGRHRSTLYRMLPDVLPDNAQAPGKMRYLDRFRIDLKGDGESGFPSVKGDGRPQKGGRSSVPRSINIHQYPSDSEIEEPEIPRLPGESHKDYMLRVASLIPGLDK